MAELETLTVKLDADELLAKLEDILARKDVKLRVKRLRPNAKLPTRGSADAVGYDLCYAGDAAMGVGADAQNIVPTGLAVEIPVGYYGRVAPRSGLAAKSGIDVMAGVIDPDYRGELLVILRNHGPSPLWIEPGDRIAQLILESVATPEVEEVEELSSSDRGAGGLGSTGVK